MSVRNGWTGGQYSVLRAVLGCWLAVHFLRLLPWGAALFSRDGMLPSPALSPLYPLFPNVLFVWDAPAVVTALLCVAAVLSLLLAMGLRDRVAAVALWYVWACLFTRNPLIANPGLPVVGWLLLAHATLPPAPYGSWTARGNDDPGSGWRMPDAIHAAAWIVMAVGYSYSGWTKLVSPSWVDGSALAWVLEHPLARPTTLRTLLLSLPAPLLAVATWGALALELLFAPLALVRPLRRWLWLAMLLMHMALLALVDCDDLTLGMLVLQGFTFDPTWIPPRRAGAPSIVFYDGSCGLCHRAVRFLLAEDRNGTVFRFAPLDSDTFHAAVPESARATLPDSIVMLGADGTLRVRSAAILAIGAQLGGLWRVLATVVGVLPRALLDVAYDAVARVRRQVFTRPKTACPLLPPHLRARFV